MLRVAKAFFFLSIVSCSAISGEELVIRENLRALFPEQTISSVKVSVLPNLYEVTISASVFYVSAEGRYLFHGELIDTENRINLSEETRAFARKTFFESIDGSDLIQFTPADGDIVETLYVYTDIDCSYCRKFHRDVDKLNGAGIAVQYLAFPRSGSGSESFEKAVNVWCSPNRQKALTDAKEGRRVDSPACVNPVTKHRGFGTDMGITGTPAVYNSQGRSLGGYVPADELIELLR